MRMILLRHAVRAAPPRRVMIQRALSTPPVPTADPDWVRSAIQKMMHAEEALPNGAADPDELRRSLQVRHVSFFFSGPLLFWRLISCSISITLQNQLREAASCVQDCRDADPTARPLELATADAAIDQAVQRLLDVLEVRPRQPRTEEDWVQRIKQLRAQVKELHATAAAMPEKNDDVSQ
jgi:hypothetical protein